MKRLIPKSTLIPFLLMMLIAVGTFWSLSSDMFKDFVFRRLSSPTQTTNTTPSPTPTSLPSEKALKIAAFALVRVNDSQKRELKQRYNAENMSDTDFIRLWAKDMDNDPALLAKNEALMEKIMAGENQPSTNYIAPQYTQQPTQDNQTQSIYDQWKQQQAQDCARRQAAYSNCMAEYNSKMLEYNNCLQTNSNPNIFCYKPSSFNPCSKPLCSCVDPTKYPKLYNPMA